MSSSTSSSPTLTINFCYNSQAHQGCIQKSKPQQVSGLKPRHRVQRILEKFCKKSKLDADRECLELYKCFCNERHENGKHSPLELGMKIKRVDLGEGCRVFVKAKVSMEKQVDDDGEEISDTSNTILETDERSGIDSAESQEDAPANAGSEKISEEWARTQMYRKKTIELLGGDAFLSQSGFILPFSGAVGAVFWMPIFVSARMASRMTPRAERKKDGLFPSLLIDTVNQRIKQRQKSDQRWHNRVIRKDLVAAIEAMRSQAVMEMDELQSEFSDGSDPEEIEISSNASTFHKSCLSVSCLSVSNRVSHLWKNTSWKKQKLRSDLGPISLSDILALYPLLELAKLTPVVNNSAASVGFPPLVLQALRESLRADEASVSKGELRMNTSASGWAQIRVVSGALPILRRYLEAEANGPQSLPFRSCPSAPNSQPALSSASEFTPTSELSALKATKKRKLSDPSTTEEEKSEAKTLHKQMKKSIKKTAAPGRGGEDRIIRCGRTGRIWRGRCWLFSSHINVFPPSTNFNPKVLNRVSFLRIESQQGAQAFRSKNYCKEESSGGEGLQEDEEVASE